MSQVSIVAEELPYRWRNERGDWVDTAGRLYRSPDEDRAPRPLVYYAGYEAPAEAAAALAATGVVVVTPQQLPDDGEWPHGNPLGRGLKMDEALLRAARALPYVDNRRVLISGGSAGGYMTLMLAASSFPLSAAFPMVPPVNLPYGMAVWRHNLHAIRALRDDGVTTVMAHPGSPGISGLWTALSEWHGTAGERLWQWSPLAHLDQVTCPVVTVVTSADTLVPVPQFGGPLVAMACAGAPAVYPIDPDVVCTDDLQRRTLLGMLPPDEVQVHVFEVAPNLPLLVDPYNAPPGGQTLTAPTRTRRWLVMFVDEGAPTPDVGHFKYAVAVDVMPLLADCLAQDPAVDQLTLPKLQLLADRWLGRDWVQPNLGDRGLNDEELSAEREDVARGLQTYAALSNAHRARLDRLTQDLDEQRSRALTGLLAMT